MSGYYNLPGVPEPVFLLFSDWIGYTKDDGTIGYLLQNGVPHENTWSNITGIPTTLTGYGITDAVSLTAYNSGMALKADTSTMNTALASKVDNSVFAAGMSSKADTSAMTAGLAGKVDTSTYNSGMALKVDTSTMTSAMALKADQTALTSGLASKVDTTTYTAGLALKADTSALALKADVTVVTPKLNTPTVSYGARALNTIFQLSSTRPSHVSYSVQIVVTASIAGGQTGDVILEVSPVSDFSSGAQTVAISGLGQTYTLAVAIQGVQPQTGNVAGIVPAGWYARLRTVNTTGTPTYSVRATQEAIL